MKRYVKEFAIDFKNKYKGTKVEKEVCEKVDKILRVCNRGLITDFEAVRNITDIYYITETKPLG